MRGQVSTPVSRGLAGRGSLCRGWVGSGEVSTLAGHRVVRHGRAGSGTAWFGRVRRGEVCSVVTYGRVRCEGRG
jgi:hypothetical protein